MELEEITALYSELDVEYSQAMSGEYEDLSFRSDEITVIAGLKDGRISGFWRPVVAVGDERLQKLHIERLYDICRNIYYMDFLIDGKLSVVSQFLLRHGHKARPYYTQIIDLTKSKEELHADLRKSYKQLVKNYDYPHVLILGLDGIDRMKNARRKEEDKHRSDESWEILCKMVKKDNAYITVAFSGGVYTLTCHNFKAAYYFSGFSTTNSHSAMWTAIMEAKYIGCKSFEMGEINFSGDSKLVNISRFKKGFGGVTQVRLILEKEQ